MKIFVVLSLLMIATASQAAETKTIRYNCKQGKFSITATIDRSQGYPAWSKSVPITLNIAGEPPQILKYEPDPDDEAAENYSNENYKFYTFRFITSLTKYSGKKEIKVYNPCR